MQFFILLVDGFLVFFNYSFDGFIRDVKEFDESLSAPQTFFGLVVVDNGVTSSDVVAIEGLLRVDLVFLWTSGCEAVIDDVEFFMFGMTIFDDFDGFVVLVDILIDILWLGVDGFELSDCSELLISFGSFDWVFLFFDLDLLI